MIEKRFHRFISLAITFLFVFSQASWAGGSLPLDSHNDQAEKQVTLADTVSSNELSGLTVFEAFSKVGSEFSDLDSPLSQASDSDPAGQDSDRIVVEDASLPIPGTFVNNGVLEVEQGTIIPGKTITEDTTWRSANGPYLIHGNVTVAQGATLTIEPGTVVKFVPFEEGPGRIQYWGLTVVGVLNAQGTEDNWIVFTHEDFVPQEYVPLGIARWIGISLKGEEASQSILSYVEIGRAGFGLRLTDTSPTISHCLVASNETGIYMHNSSPTIDYVTASRNEGSGFEIYRDSNPVITNSAAVLNAEGFVVGSWQNLGGGPPLRVNGTSIFGNRRHNVSTAAGGVPLPGTVFNFQGNWWGTADPAVIEAKIEDFNDYEAYPLVDYSGFLTSQDQVPAPLGGTYVTGTLTEDVTWRKEDGPFFIGNDVLLPRGVTLTIESGTVVKFIEFSNFRVEGAIKAQGTAGDKISFLAEPNISGPAAFFLFTFQGEGASQSEISYAELVSDYNGFYIEDSSPTFSHVTVKVANPEGSPPLVGFSVGGDSSPRLIDVTASDLFIGLAITENASPWVTHSTFTNNRIAGIYYENLTAGVFQPNPIVNWSTLDNDTNVRITGLEGEFLDPNAVWDFTNNWWGTTDPTAIEASIGDHNDFDYLPFVNYTPFLTGEPSQFLGDAESDVDADDVRLLAQGLGRTALTAQEPDRMDLDQDGDVDDQDMQKQIDILLNRMSVFEVFTLVGDLERDPSQQQYQQGYTPQYGATPQYAQPQVTPQVGGTQEVHTKYNPRTGQTFPEHYQYDPATGEELKYIR